MYIKTPEHLMARIMTATKNAVDQRLDRKKRGTILMKSKAKLAAHRHRKAQAAERAKAMEYTPPSRRLPGIIKAHLYSVDAKRALSGKMPKITLPHVSIQDDPL